MHIYEKLLSTYQLSSNIKLKNHIVLAPLIQRTASDDGIPDEIMFDFYLKRADCGLIITEATMISEDARAYSKIPGIYNLQQVKTWSKIVKEVHSKKGKIFIQLWHPGRISHRNLLNGKQPLAPSQIRANGKIPWSDLDYDLPIAMTESHMDQVIQSYEFAAQNALLAGFDGVEIHAGNGYLIEQFLRNDTNKRNDKYGGIAANKTSFPLKIIENVIKKIGANKVGVRLSLENSTTIDFNDSDKSTYIFFIKKLNELPIAYIHLSSENDFNISPILKFRPSEFLKFHTTHTLIACGSYNPELAEKAIRANLCNLVSFGRLFLNHSDLVSKIKNEDVSLTNNLQEGN